MIILGAVKGRGPGVEVFIGKVRSTITTTRFGNPVSAPDYYITHPVLLPRMDDKNTSTWCHLYIQYVTYIHSIG